MTEAERKLGHRWFEQVWNQKRRDAIAEMLAPAGVIHDGGLDSMGPDGFYPFFDRLNAAFSDLHVQVHDSIADGDKLCVRWSCTARHTGSALGPAPTGVTIYVTGMTLIRVANGQAQECWQNWDMLGMLEQINAGHSGGAAKSATYIGA
jgi:predicted ester cyclase